MTDFPTLADVLAARNAIRGIALETKARRKHASDADADQPIR